jgi:hypothetical protein
MPKVVSLVPRGFRTQLREAQQQRQPVRVWRDPIEPGSYIGYVLGVGAEFFLLWVVDDDMRSNGWVALRHQDISHLEAPYVLGDFLEKALAIQGLEPPVAMDFELDDLAGVLRSAQRLAPLVTLLVSEDDQDESEYPVVLYVGQLMASEGDLILMQEINANGYWIGESSAFGTDEILGVAVQDHYAQMLFKVAEQNRLTQAPNPAPSRLKLAPPQDP